MFISSKLSQETGYRQAPVANAMMYYRGNTYASLLYRGETDPNPGQLPDLNRWMYVHQFYDRTAMIGNPNDYRQMDDTRYFWAELTGTISSTTDYSNISGDYDPGVGWSDAGFVTGTPPRVSGKAGAGIRKYKKDNTNIYMFCVFINRQLVYSVTSDIGGCPILITMPYGFGLICFTRVRYQGYTTNLTYISEVRSFSRSGGSYPSWNTSISGCFGFGHYYMISGEAQDFNYVTTYDANGNYIGSQSLLLQYSTIPEVPYSNTQGETLFSQRYAYIFSEEMDDSSYRSSYAKSVTPTFSLNRKYHRGVSYTLETLHFYWQPKIRTYALDTTSIDNINYWSAENPILTTTSNYSNEVEYNPLSTSSYGLGLILLYPDSTGNEGNYSTFSNWGVYIARDSNTFQFKSYQRYFNFWTVNIGSYSNCNLLCWYVTAPFSPVENKRSDSVTIYILFQRTTNGSIFMRKCTLDSMEHIHSMSSANFTFETIELGTYSFPHPMVGLVDSDSYFIDFNNIGTPAAGQKLCHAANGSSWTNEGIQYYDYNGKQLSPYGSRFSILGYPNGPNRFFGVNGYSDLMEYDLEEICIDLDNIQGSLNYMNSG